MNRLGLTHTVVKTAYALLTPDTRQPSRLPGWSQCTVHVLVSAALGAGFSQYVVTFEAGGRAEGRADRCHWFFFLVGGTATVNDTRLSKGGYACIPPGEEYRVDDAADGTTVLVFRRACDRASEEPGLASTTGHADEVPDTPFQGDASVRVQTLVSGASPAAMAVGMLTFCPGATLPPARDACAESGVMLLSGGGIFRLGEDWHPVAAGDALWISGDCPQWFLAAGPEPARWIYYRGTQSARGSETARP
jgi:(S)-ureidoglycine aminohydrolase